MRVEGRRKEMSKSNSSNFCVHMPTNVKLCPAAILPDRRPLRRSEKCQINWTPQISRAGGRGDVRARQGRTAGLARSADSMRLQCAVRHAQGKGWSQECKLGGRQVKVSRFLGNMRSNPRAGFCCLNGSFYLRTRRIDLNIF